MANNPLRKSRYQRNSDRITDLLVDLTVRQGRRNLKPGILVSLQTSAFARGEFPYPPAVLDDRLVVSAFTHVRHKREAHIGHVLTRSFAGADNMLRLLSISTEQVVVLRLGSEVKAPSGGLKIEKRPHRAQFAGRQWVEIRTY